MAAWSDGYFTDIQYTAKFYHHLAPSNLTFACVRRGVRPPDLAAGATYLELGCGQGFGLNLLAAANPGIRFIGLDFHPGQIANAQRLAAEAGLENVTFDDLSFQQTIDLPQGVIPRCDVIVLHGILSWVSPENRALIVRILDRYLKPGGLVSVSYNTLPGWSANLPVRNLLKVEFDRASGDPETRARAAFQTLKAMVETGARGFGAKAKNLIEQAAKQETNYLVHEYLNEHFHPLYHAEVAGELAAARLSFAASSNLSDDVVAFVAPEGLRAQIEAETDPIRRETLMDYASDRQFRRDIFIRGRNELGAAERQARLHGVRFALQRPIDQVPSEIRVPGGQLKTDPQICGPVVVALVESPKTFAELAALPALAAIGETALLNALGLLVESSTVHPLPPVEAPAEPARRFNRAVAGDYATSHRPRALASPVTGTGVPMDFTALFCIDAALRGCDHATAAQQGWTQIQAAGVRLQKNFVTLDGAEAHVAELLERLETFDAKALPIYRNLGII